MGGNCRYKVALLGLLLVSACAGECPPTRLIKGQFLDQNCQLFRHVRENGIHYIVKEKGDKVVAREVIDCSKAVEDEDGTMEYHSKLANADFYCGPAPKHHEGEK